MLESPDMVPRTTAIRQIYLASISPRRKELLSLTRIEYTLLPAYVDETPQPSEDGVEYVGRIARSKAAAAGNLPGIDGVIIAADTAVIDSFGRERAEILGKPRDPENAVEMLRGLRGHTHQVFTAVSILSTQDGKMRFDLCKTDVPMRNYSEGEIKEYVITGDPMDKAGAYAIQHAGFHPVEGMLGCYANVMGLPLCHLVRNLKGLGIQPAVDVPLACQAALMYKCPVYEQILNEKTFQTSLN